MKPVFLIVLLPLLLGISCTSMKKPGDPTAVTGEMPDSARAEDIAKVDEFFAGGGKHGFHPAADKSTALSAADTKYVVELDQQRVYLYHDGALIAASRLSSGRSGYRTETGNYTIGQQNRNHRSNLYGSYVSTGGRTIAGDVRAGSDPQPEGARFVGASMKYFQRFERKGSPTAMGFHQGIVPNHPASHGCIRLPASMAHWFFETVPKGTPVQINGTKYGVKPGTRQAGGGRRAPRKFIPAKTPEAGDPASADPASPTPGAGTTAVEAEGATSMPVPADAPAPASEGSTPPAAAEPATPAEPAAPPPSEPAAPPPAAPAPAELAPAGN